MHNRSIVDLAFAQVDAAVTPVMQTNSVLTLARHERWLQHAAHDGYDPWRLDRYR